MARKKKQDEADKPNPWPGRISRMKKYLEKNSKTWARNEKLIFGASTSSAIPGGESSTSDSSNELAYGWGLLKSLETQIYVFNPDPIVESYSKMLQPIADVLTNILKFDIAQMNVKHLGNLLLLDSFISGYGVMAQAVNTTKKKGRIKDDETGEEEDAEAITDQEYIARRVKPKDILFDPSGILLDLSDHRYIAVAWYPTIQQLKDDPEMDLPDNIDEAPEVTEANRTEKGKSGSDERMGLNPHSAGEKDPEYKTTLVWEIWDKIGNEVVYYLEFGSKIIKRMPWPAKFKIGHRELFPVTLMYFHPVVTGF